MESSTRLLEGFDAVERLSTNLEAGGQPSVDVLCSELALGPLAEILVLRRSWREVGVDVRISGTSDARHAAMSAVARSPVASRLVNSRVGALHIVGQGEMLESECHEFVAATGRLAHESGMPLEASRTLKGVLGELVDNVSVHGGPGAKGIAAFEIHSKAISVVVADTGQGIVRGFLESQPERHGLIAADALECAVKQNRSRFRERGRGLGFASVLNAMRAMDGALRVRSDDASIEIEGPADSATWYLKDQPTLQGFVVSLYLSWR